MKASGKISVGVSLVVAMVLVFSTQKSKSLPAEPPKRDNQMKSVATSSAASAITSPPLVVLPPPPPSSWQIERLQHATVARPAQKVLEQPKPAPSMRQKNIPTPKKPQQVKRKSAEIKISSLQEGRVLLRLLEQGQGPNLEIAWPRVKQDRQRLYEFFVGCYGLKSALLDSNQRLYTKEGVSGASWQPDFDRYSGFVRIAAGLVSEDERAILTDIRKHHLGIEGVAVRLFPRRLDAVMLAGLHQTAGSGAEIPKSIRASYALRNSEVVITDIRVEGRLTPGQINLTRQLGPCPIRS